MNGNCFKTIKYQNDIDIKVYLDTIIIIIIGKCVCPFTAYCNMCLRSPPKKNEFNLDRD